MIVIFQRAEGFYPIEFLDPDDCGKSLVEQAKDHAACNPGTLKISNALTGEVLWSCA